MMRRAVIITLAILCGGCQLQVNLASSVVNVPVVKTQYKSDDAQMLGSNLKDIADGMKQDAGDVSAQ